MNKTNVEHITLWGPTHSGKTFLIKAFQKRIIQLDRESESFSYSLSTFSGFEEPRDLVEKPTEEPKEHTFVFSRKAKIMDPRGEVSTHTHFINILDDSGINTVELNPYARFNLENSDFLVLVLDPQFSAVETKDENAGTTDEKKDTSGPKKGISPIYGRSPDQAIYCNHVQKLFNYLEKRGKDIFISVCITKIDQMAFKFREPYLLIDFLFGTSMKSLFDAYIKKPSFSLAFFSTSSVGYQNKNFDTPNFKNNEKEGDSQLAEINLWAPYNVESPFFWLFDHIERKRLDVIPGKLPKFVKNGIREERQKNYIPYKINFF